MTTSDGPGLFQCEDYLQFQTALREARLIDDKIVYALNNSIPTVSFKGQVNAAEKCQELHKKIAETYDLREKALNKCIALTQESLTSARAKGASGEIRPLQLSLRLYRNELSVEEVIRARTESIFHEKCRDHFTAKLSS